MALPFLAIQLSISVVLILAVTWLAVKLGLGDDVRLNGEAQVRELAETSICGFDPVDLALDRAGIGALVRGKSGKVMLLRRHGAQFASRLLDSHTFARLDRNFLTIGSGDPHFGQVTLDLGDQAQIWAASLRRLGA